MEALVIRDTFDSLASHDTPVTPRRLASGRPHHAADAEGDVDAGPGALSGLPVSDAAGPQSLWSQAGGSALGTVAPRPPPAEAEFLLCQWRLPPPYFYRAAGPAGRSLGAANAAAHTVAGAHRRGAGRNGRGTPEPWPGPGRQSQHAPAPTPSPAPPRCGHPPGARRRRLGRSERSEVWDGADRSRAAATARPPARSGGQNRGPMVAGPSWRPRDHPGSIESLCGRCPARGPRRHPGRGPLSPVTEPGGGPGPGI